MAYISPKWLVVEFLRRRLTDPRSRAESATSDTFTATDGQTNFELSPTSGSKASCVTSVTDAGVTQTKQEDYYVDFENRSTPTVIFHSGRTLDNEIIVNYKEGTSNWIYPDKPQIDLTRSSFPRISVTLVSDTPTRLGNYEADLEHLLRFQVDVWAKEPAEGEVWTISGKKYAGDSLAEYLVYEVVDAFNEYESDLHPALWGFLGEVGPKDMPFDYNFQLHRKTMEFMMHGINAGKVDWL